MSGPPVAPAWTVGVRANVNGPGDSNIRHYRPGAFWSGTCYVDDGGDGSGGPLGGEFERLDPRGPGPALLAPTLVFAGEGVLPAGGTGTIQPRPGLLFLFPSWRYQQVRACRGTRARISTAFNLRI